MTASSEKSIAAQIDAEARHLNWLNVSSSSLKGRELTKTHEAIERTRKSLENLRRQAHEATGVSAADPTATFLQEQPRLVRGAHPGRHHPVVRAAGRADVELRLCDAARVRQQAGAGRCAAAAGRRQRPGAGRAGRRGAGRRGAGAAAGRRARAGADRGAAADRRHASALRIADHRLAGYVATLPVGEQVIFGTLYDGYCAHCRRHGVEPMATNQLGAALKRSGVERSRKHGGATYYTRKALAEVAQKRPRRHGAASGPLPGDIDVGRSCVDGLHNPRPVH